VGEIGNGGCGEEPKGGREGEEGGGIVGALRGRRMAVSGAAIFLVLCRVHL